MTDYKSLDISMRAVSDALMDHYGPIDTQLSSYNYAVEQSIPKIITSTEVKIAGHSVTFPKVFFKKPCYKEVNDVVTYPTPKVCFDRSMSYFAGLYVDVIHRTPNGVVHKFKKKYFGEFPVMVMSSLCNLREIFHDKVKVASLNENIFEVGGYFIIKGSPKIVIPQVKQGYNHIHVFMGKAITVPGKPKFSIYVETRSGGASSFTSIVQAGIIKATGLIGVTLKYIEPGTTIPIGVMFKAMGITDNEEIIKHIINPEWVTSPPTLSHKNLVLTLVKALEYTYNIETQEDALAYITNRTKKVTTVGEEEEDDEDDEDDDYSEDFSEFSTKGDSAKRNLSILFLSHVGNTELHFKNKALFLGYMIRKLLLCHAGIIAVDDRDHFGKKALFTADMLLGPQFYKSWCQLTKKISTCIENDIKTNKHINVTSYITLPSIITNSLVQAISSNKWKCSGVTDGISQSLEMFNRAAVIGALRKIVIPVPKKGGKIEAPRHLKGVLWGICCPSETPEGENVGTILHLSMMCIIPTPCDPFPIQEILKKLDIVHIDDISSASLFLENTRVFLNGNPIGYTIVPQEITDTLRSMKRKLVFSPTVSIAYDLHDNEIRINTEGGRFCRGVVVLDKGGKMRMTKSDLQDLSNGKWSSTGRSSWMALLEKGHVEIISKDEEEYLNVAVYPSDLDDMGESTREKYTHVEMSPDMLLGTGTNTSPYNNHNQSPRNIYQGAMNKQAISIPGANNFFNCKGKWSTLVYPQKPIISTNVSKKMGFSDEPMGINATVIISNLLGYGQEDSLIFNKDAVKRGFMCSYYFMTHEVTIKHLNTTGALKYEQFEIPQESTCNEYKGNFDKLRQKGKWCYVPVGVKVEKGDVLIGTTETIVCTEKYVSKTGNAVGANSKSKTNISAVYDHRWSSYVHSVRCGYNGDGYQNIILVTIQYRRPIVADKFSACHGQKGTVGAIKDSTEMQFPKRYGYVPNIIINPLAFPSRMTVGMIIEMLLATAVVGTAYKHPEFDKPLCLDGISSYIDKCQTQDVNSKDLSYSSNGSAEFDPETDYSFKNLGIVQDGTPYVKGFDPYTICEALKKMGINEFSEEVMVFNGVEQKVLTFSGVVFYQRLRHMVIDKIHARATGSRHNLHRQPTEGRKKKGGFRTGHMEVACLFAQGVSEMVLDRMLYQSDVYQMPVCSVCGLQAIDDGNKMYCKLCKKSKVRYVQLPFGMKLLSQEMQVIGPIGRMITRTDQKDVASDSVKEYKLLSRKEQFPSNEKDSFSSRSKTLPITEKVTVAKRPAPIGIRKLHEESTLTVTKNTKGVFCKAIVVDVNKRACEMYACYNKLDDILALKRGTIITIPGLPSCVSQKNSEFRIGEINHIDSSMLVNNLKIIDMRVV